MESSTRLLIIGIIATVVAFMTGFLGGYHANGSGSSTATSMHQKLTRKADREISERLMNEIKAENIRQNLRDITKYPRLAGTSADLGQAEELKSFWEHQGFDKATLYPYDVLLSYPQEDKPNRIVLYNEHGEVTFTSQLREKILHPDQNRSDIIPPFSAYSASGEPQGDLVYVNYAQEDDFLHLLSLGIDPKGQICIARSGRMFRGDKARFAEKYQCAGLILYAETDKGYDKVYPDSYYLPGTGVAQGSLFSYGDPLTPGYPAKESAYRIRQDQAGLPTIAIHPIGYDDAQVFLSNMSGPVANTSWTGALPITYRLGPGFMNPRWKIQMIISTTNKNVTSYNAVGFIRGSVEPDRYVILGNHRDTWVLGAIDPSGGTAAMMELSRALGTLLKEGWRPRRSILVCSWGAEEFGLTGSREWVEEFGKLLEQRAVAYINVDVAVLGNFTFRGKAMPLMFELMYDVAKTIPNPNPFELSAGRHTVYDTWLARLPDKTVDRKLTGVPQITPPGFGSDYASFICLSGITTADLRYHYDTNVTPGAYSLYHTGYETFHLVETYFDPHFIYHKVITQFWGELTLRLADDYVIPFDVTSYGTFLSRSLETIEKSYEDLFKYINIRDNINNTLAYFEEATVKFKKSAEIFSETLKHANLDNPIEVRMLNDKLMHLDRIFIDSNGLPNFPIQSHFYTRNVLYGQAESYAGSLLPALLDSLFDLDMASEEQKEENIEQVKFHLAIVTHWIEVAASSLVDNIEW